MALEVSPSVAERYPEIVPRLYEVHRNGPRRLSHIGVDIEHPRGTQMSGGVETPPESVVGGQGEMGTGQ